MGNTATVGAGPQHLMALQHANRVRLARAELKRKVAAQEVSAAEVILTCPWQAESMTVSDLLMSQRRWGRTRSRRLLLSLAVPENKRISTLTARQRTALAATLTRAEPVPRSSGADRDGDSPNGDHPPADGHDAGVLHERLVPA